VLLMDEPLAHLDPPHQADWLALVRERVRAGQTVVSVLHEITLALMADDVLVLREGRVHYAGPSDAPEARAALLDVFDQRLALHRIDGGWVVLPR
jgi:iron complex transport system ATP-binding protein